MGNGCNDLCFNGGASYNTCDFVRDRLCSGWSVPGDSVQNVYMVSGVNVYASGFLSYDFRGI